MNRQASPTMPSSALFIALAFALLLSLSGCTSGSGAANNNNNGGSSGAVATAPARVATGRIALNAGKFASLTLNLFDNGFLNGSVRFDPAATRAELTAYLNGNHDINTGAFTASGTANINGVDTSIQISGTAPRNGTSGNATIAFGGNSFVGTCSEPASGTLNLMTFSNATGTNGTTSNLTFGVVSNTLSSTANGDGLHIEAKIGDGNNARVLDIQLNTAQQGFVRSGLVFPIFYSTQSASYVTRITYGEQGTFANGFARAWIARSGTLIIDSIQSGVITFRLMNALFEPYAEAQGNPATGTFVANLLGQTLVGTGGNGGGNNGGGNNGGGNNGGGTATLSRILASSIPLNNGAQASLTLNAFSDNSLTGTARFNSDATRAVYTVLLSGTNDPTANTFSMTGSYINNGATQTLEITGTLPTGNSGGSVTLKSGAKTFSSTFVTPANFDLGRLVFSSAENANANTTQVTLDKITGTFNGQANPGEHLIADAVQKANVQARGLRIDLRTSQTSKIVPGAVFQVRYDPNPSSVALLVAYGEQGNVTSGFARIWAARSGTLVIDAVQNNVITFRLVNVYMDAFSEVQGNKATGAFIINLRGAITITP